MKERRGGRRWWWVSRQYATRAKRLSPESHSRSVTRDSSRVLAALALGALGSSWLPPRPTYSRLARPACEIVARFFFHPHKHIEFLTLSLPIEAGNMSRRPFNLGLPSSLTGYFHRDSFDFLDRAYLVDW